MIAKLKKKLHKVVVVGGVGLAATLAVLVNTGSVSLNHDHGPAVPAITTPAESQGDPAGHHNAGHHGADANHPDAHLSRDHAGHHDAHDGSGDMSSARHDPHANMPESAHSNHQDSHTEEDHSHDHPMHDDSHSNESKHDDTHHDNLHAAAISLKDLRQQRKSESRSNAKATKQSMYAASARPCEPAGYWSEDRPFECGLTRPSDRVPALEPALA